MYAPRVQYFGIFPMPPAYTGIPHIFQQLVMSEMIVFPNLCSLDVDIYKELLPCTRILFTPKIRSFGAMIGGLGFQPSRLAQMLFDSVPWTMPALQNLTIQCSIVQGHSLRLPILRACQGLSMTLTGLEIEGCKIELKDVVDLLSKAQCLTFLAIEISDSPLPMRSLRPTAEISTIKLQVGALIIAAKLMEAVSMATVNNFHAITESVPHPDLYGLGRALQQSLSIEALEILTIDWRGTSPQTVLSTITGASFVPLLAFHKLHYVVVRSFSRTNALSFDLESAILHRMISSWPHLRHLEFLRSLPYDAWTPGLKVKPDLFDLLKGWKRLDFLGLDFDFACDASALDAGFSTPEQRSDILIYVGFSTVAQPKILAAILSDNFRGLRIITQFGQSEVHLKAWNDVNECLKIMDVLRQQERRRRPGSDNVEVFDLPAL